MFEDINSNFSGKLSIINSRQFISFTCLNRSPDLVAVLLFYPNSLQDKVHRIWAFHCLAGVHTETAAQYRKTKNNGRISQLKHPKMYASESINHKLGADDSTGSINSRISVIFQRKWELSFVTPLTSSDIFVFTHRMPGRWMDRSQGLISKVK